ncbi:OB-fold nucleic acid binding domain-containing protein [Halobacterium wangiae]|uniref:OB-fold nucleic acid binding domain-containing protein n=1 Tax=Halobacterium wangiae TaxID=2902623 RepID=UPI001E5A8C8F|nr:OB-fold nucleic acid binding domain-containing protein [Halobacterium wangiae]
MSSKNPRGSNGVGQAVETTKLGETSEREADSESDIAEIEAVDEVRVREERLRATVDMEIRARIDSNHPEAMGAGLTLAEEERALAREWEIKRTHHRFDRRESSDREARTREYVSKRTPSELYEARPVDPREELGCEMLGEVNREAMRLESKCRGFSRAATSRVLAGRVQQNGDVTTGVLETLEKLALGPGQIIPFGDLERVERDEVTVEGWVERLFEPSHPAIAQVGLLEDESGRCKVTIWKRSNQSLVREGERVRVSGAALSFYEGRPSLAVTGWSTLRFTERERYWEA